MNLRCVDTSHSWNDIVQDVMSYGTEIVGRDGRAFTEIVNFTGIFDQPRMRYINPEGRFLNLPFAIVELLDIMLDCNPGIRGLYNKQMTHYINPATGQYDGHYGDRILKYNQLIRVVRELESEKNSRRAVITIHNPAHEYYTGVDVACTLSLQFLLRGGKLNLITTMRSEDLYLGFCYDTFQFQFLQEIVASMLHVELGQYAHNVGSLHIYTDDVPKLAKIRNDDVYAKYKLIRMIPASYSYLMVQLKSLWFMAMECIAGEMEKSRQYFDCITDPYLMQCGYVLQAEGHRRKHSLGEVEWRNMIRNEFEDYFRKKEAPKVFDKVKSSDISCGGNR